MAHGTEGSLRTTAVIGLDVLPTNLFEGLDAGSAVLAVVSIGVANTERRFASVIDILDVAAGSNEALGTLAGFAVGIILVDAFPVVSTLLVVRANPSHGFKIDRSGYTRTLVIAVDGECEGRQG